MIHLTEKAQEKIKELIRTQNNPNVFFRVGVKGGGCSGFSYDVKFDDKLNENDKTYEVDGIKVVSDPKGALYLFGMTVDYSTELVNGGFQFINPNAKGTCGCGTSFTV